MATFKKAITTTVTITLLLAGSISLSTGAYADGFNTDDFIKPHFDPNQNEIGFRVGIPILDWEIRKQPGQRVKETDYNEIDVHNFHLKSVAADGMSIGISLRWKKFESDLFGGTYKRAETNCDANVLVRLYVTPEHSIAVYPPLVNGIDCTTSGFGLEEIVDYMTQGLTWIASGGQNSIGFFDILAGVGSLIYDFDAYFNDATILTDPVSIGIVSDNLLPFVRQLYDLGDNENNVYLSDIRYDSKGVSLIFSYPEWLEDAARQIVSVLNLTNGIPGDSSAGQPPITSPTDSAEVIDQAIIEIFLDVYNREPSGAEYTEAQADFISGSSFDEVYEKVLARRNAVLLLLNQYMLDGF